MKLFLPKQHGAWAMLIIPFWLGVAAAGDSDWRMLLLFAGWFFLYLGTYPFLLLFKRKKKKEHMVWAAVYFTSAFLLLIIPVVQEPKLVWLGIFFIPFMLLNMYFSSKNQDRAFLNDLCAIMIFSLSGLAGSILINGYVRDLSILITICTLLFFTGSTLYVKTMIREKSNITYKRLSWGYHIAIPLAIFILGEPLVAIAYLPSLFRAIYLYGKKRSVMRIGIYEIINSALFFIIMILYVLEKHPAY
ncbi:YwiC-like family protein [Cytobacillus gottheilii]|uniref:YwiC-like family protein n=1 Tax=Cytobacillus gottheilii TaxID=859144 RepID=UPI00083002C2|nr:YwiC-like family protein [Cytobacillus gottheilii]